MQRRRSVLALAAAALAPTAGCTSAFDGLRAPARTRPPAGRSRAEGAQISATDAAFPDASYVPENDTVRYPATRSGDEVEDEYLAFETWAFREGAAVAADAVQRELADSLPDTSLLSVAFGGREQADYHVSVAHETRVDESGDVVAAPDVSVSRLVDTTPRTVTATVELDGASATHDYPVFVAWHENEPGPKARRLSRYRSVTSPGTTTA
jgi:hypothetical protein